MKIELQHVDAGYVRGHPVLKDISICLKEGHSTAIAGPNGAGKTTLLRVLAGLIPYSGSIRVTDPEGNRRELSSMKRREIAECMALMPQFSGLYFSYTAWETVELGRYVRSRSRFGRETSSDREAVRTALRAADAEELSSLPLDTLSGGQLQRVLLARTFAQETPFILLDEPTNHLDLKYRAELTDYLKRWSEERTQGVCNTVIGVYHELTEALRLAQDIVFLSGGRIAAAGRADEIMTAELLTEVFGMDVAARMREDLRIWERV